MGAELPRNSLSVAKEGKVYEQKKLLQPLLGTPEGTKMTGTIFFLQVLLWRSSLVIKLMTKWTQNLFQQLMLGGKVEDKLLVTLLPLRAWLKMVNWSYAAFLDMWILKLTYLKVAGVLVHLPHQILGQQFSRLQVFSRGRGNVLELAFREVVLSSKVKPLGKLS